MNTFTSHYGCEFWAFCICYNLRMVFVVFRGNKRKILLTLSLYTIYITIEFC